MAGFATALRGMRRRLLGKQLILSTGVGCTEAAVSYWENGKRAPDGRRFQAIVSVLRNAGASPVELQQLQEAWRRLMTTRLAPKNTAPIPAADVAIPSPTPPSTVSTRRR